MKVMEFDFRDIGFLGLSHLLDCNAWPMLEMVCSRYGYGEAEYVFNERVNCKFTIC